MRNRSDYLYLAGLAAAAAVLIALTLAACTAGDRPIDQATALQWTDTPAALSVDSPAVRLAAAADLRPAYETYHDDDNGALVYLFPNGGGWVLPYTATPGAPAATPTATAAALTPAPATSTAGPGLTPSVTLFPTAAPPAATVTPAAAVGLTNGGFEQGSAGWLTYPLAPGMRANLEDAQQGALLVDSGRYSLRLARDEFSAAPPILRGGAMGRVTGITPGQTLTVSCRVFGVQGSTDPFFNNAIRTIYSQARLGFGAAGFGNTNDPQVLRGGAQVVWSGAGLDYQWSTVTVSGVAFAAQVPVFIEVQIGQEWSAFPFAAGVIDSCGVSVR